MAGKNILFINSERGGCKVICFTYQKAIILSQKIFRTALFNAAKEVLSSKRPMGVTITPAPLPKGRGVFTS